MNIRFLKVCTCKRNCCLVTLAVLMHAKYSQSAANLLYIYFLVFFPFCQGDLGLGADSRATSYVPLGTSQETVESTLWLLSEWVHILLYRNFSFTCYYIEYYFLLVIILCVQWLVFENSFVCAAILLISMHITIIHAPWVSISLENLNYLGNI